MTEVLYAAQNYLRDGWALTPLYGVTDDGACRCRAGAACASAGKHPRGMKVGWRILRTGPEAFEWFETHPEDNIGIVTGTESGFFAVDVDGPTGIASLREWIVEHGPLPDTRTVKTGSGGRHLYFRLPAGVTIRNSAKSIAPGIDIRGDGGQVVAPPSRSGRGSYEVAADHPIAEAPEWLLALVTAGADEAPAAAEVVAGEPVDWSHLPPYIREAASVAKPDGERHPHFFALVAACREEGLTQGQTVTIVAPWCAMVGKFVGRVEAEVARVWGKTPDPAARDEWIASAAAGSVLPDEDDAGGSASADGALDAQIAREATKQYVIERARAAARQRLADEAAAGVAMPIPITLDDLLATPDEDAEYRIAGVWPTGGRVILAAPAKAGKTTMLGNLIRSLVDGDPFLGAYAVTSRVGRVVLVDDELDPRTIKRWLRDQGIVNAAAVVVVPLRGRVATFDVVDPGTRARWAEVIGAADVLIIDCLRPIIDALGLSEDKDAGKVLAAIGDLAGALGIGEVLVNHHMGHTGERARGDSSILGWPDANWRLVTDDDEDERRVYFTAHGRDVDVTETLLGFDPESRRLVTIGGSRRDGRTTNLVAAVVAYVAEHPDANTTAIKKGVSGRGEDVGKAIHEAHDRGLITRRQEGQQKLYRVTDSPDSDRDPEPADIPVPRVLRDPGPVSGTDDAEDMGTGTGAKCRRCGEALDQASVMCGDDTCSACAMCDATTAND